MSRLADFRRAEHALREQLQKLESMKADTSLNRELEFAEKVKGLMAEYQFSANEVLAILDPNMATQGTGASKTTRRPRRTKVYRHPDTGATIETRGANHKLLKQWKAKYGTATVESWLQP